jgi:hypothetical protein
LIKRIKESYSLDVDLEKLEGEEFNNYLKEHKDLKRISLKQLEKVSNNKSLINEYIKNFEGLQPGTNYNRKIVREYVDQILSPEFDKKFSEFVEKIREMYFKKKQTNPLKVFNI